MFGAMADVLKLIWWTVVGLFRSRVSLEAEILTLRQQKGVLLKARRIVASAVPP
jgi:hypothetical protein